MDLYDDLDTKAKASQIDGGWSSGIKMLQTQLAAKKAQNNFGNSPHNPQLKKASV